MAMLRTALLFLLCAPALAAQQPPDSLVVDLAGRVRVFRAAELRALPRGTVAASFGRAPQTYRGVPLVGVLLAAGLDTSQLHGPALAQTLLVEAADGYRMAFGLADVDSVVTGRVVLLADSVDGHTLTAQDGPWRLVVAGDRHARRSVRRVTVVRLVAAPAPYPGGGRRPD
jgi:hypothetical protein